MASVERGFLKPVQKIVDGVAVSGTKYSDAVDLTKHSGAFSLWIKASGTAPSVTIKRHYNYALNDSFAAGSTASTDWSGNADTVVENFSQKTLTVEDEHPVIAPFIEYSFEPGAGDGGDTTLEMWIVVKGG